MHANRDSIMKPAAAIQRHVSFIKQRFMLAS